MTELKPCPFCGGKADLNRYNGGDWWFSFIKCSQCGVRTVNRIQIGQAIEDWNWRVTE